MDISNSSLVIDENEMQFQYTRASGPGGQNVNKISSAVQLRFDITHSPSLQPAVKERLIKLGGNRVTQDGILIIEAKRFRMQEDNKIDAINRLKNLIIKAGQEPVIRKKTKPGVTASAARVSEKKRRGGIKRMRHYDPEEWE